MENIKKGFKQTEIGILPEDWEVKTLQNQIVNIASGRSSTKNTNGVYPIYGSTGQIGYSNNFDYEGDKILVARVGANAGSINRVSGKYCVSDNTLMITNNSQYDIGFSFYQLLYLNLNKLVFGSGQPLITGGQLKNIKIPLPPTLSEQTAIAAALSEVDELIQTLEKQIQKKKAVKQGAMHVLLSPKEGWITESIAAIFNISAGGDVDKDNYSAIKTNDFLYPIYANSLENKGLYGYTKFPKYDKGAITVTGRGSLGYAEYRNEPFDAIVRLLVLQPKKEIEGYFFSEYINKFINFAYESTGVPQLTAPQIAKYKISFPPTLSKQESIAAILSDMDAEIEALTAKKEKYKGVKQAMMQELLTGKTRLVAK